ncbi:hypothetical protein ACFWXA_30970 [Streptomyces atroolivaceus]|uniref:hypothetical protein n=1 Tax=Streptomyces atroolivaceus TaxID=66869 RepID=UPI00365BFCBE
MTTDTPAPDTESEEPSVLTLATLRARLEEFSHLPGDTPVILQKDAEGNGFSPLSGADEGMYDAETTYSGEAYMTSEQIAADPSYTEEDEAPEEAVRAIVLWPLN